MKLHEGKVAMDDGDAEEVRAWQPNPASPHLSLDSHIRATMSPHLAHVFSGGHHGAGRHRRRPQFNSRLIRS